MVPCSAAMFATVAFAMDLRSQKVANGWIAIGWLWGLGVRFMMSGWDGMFLFFSGAMMPILWLFPLFFFRMLGAGDVKLLSVLGGLLGCRAVVRLMMYSFFLGGLLSLGVLTINGMLLSRLRYFSDYFQTYFKERKRRPYYQTGNRAENLHFTLPILLGVFLYVGGVV